jgi:tetratricopeptide (TPR) repeat protein
MVYNEERLPVQDVDVALVSKDKTMATTKTDVHGRFALPAVPFGRVTLTLSKPNYETLSWSFSFDGPAQVMYAKMINMSELLDDASDGIAKRDWSFAQGFIDRALKLEPDNEVNKYLQGQLFARQGKTDEAVKLLEKLSADDSPSFTVELTLGDIYQYDLKQSDKALYHLRKALTIKDDLDVENRIMELGKQ